MAEMTNDNILIFRTPEDDWGEFCNQYPSPFTYMGNRFETVEQFLYYMKAVFGRSNATAEKILACGGDSSALLKASKKQRLLENNRWDAVRPQIMRLGMRQKFLQNPELRKKLLSTGFRLLVEIPKEGLLGRLLPASEDWAHDPGKWKGRNQTGKVLMQVRTDLRCADRLVGPDDRYVFPEEPFILRTPAGQMTLKELSMLPGARESVRAYAETAQQHIELFVADADDFIGKKQLSLVTMERAIVSNRADVENALNRARADSAGAENAGEADAVLKAETEGNIDAEAGTGLEEAGVLGEAAPGTSPDLQPVSDEEKLPDDIPAEGFYELLYDLDEMMKLGII